MKSNYRVMDCSEMLAKDPFQYVDGDEIEIGDDVCVVEDDDTAWIGCCYGFGVDVPFNSDAWYNGRGCCSASRCWIPQVSRSR